MRCVWIHHLLGLMFISFGPLFRVEISVFHFMCRSLCSRITAPHVGPLRTLTPAMTGQTADQFLTQQRQSLRERSKTRCIYDSSGKPLSGPIDGPPTPSNLSSDGARSCEPRDRGMSRWGIPRRRKRRVWQETKTARSHPPEPPPASSTCTRTKKLDFGLRSRAVN